MALFDARAHPKVTNNSVVTQKKITKILKVKEK